MILETIANVPRQQSFYGQQKMQMIGLLLLLGFFFLTCRCVAKAV